LLVGDIGGTRTRLALYERQRPHRLLVEAVMMSREHKRFDDIARSFLRGTQTKPEIAVLGVAGPVRNGSAHITNLDWKIDERALSRSLGIPRVALYNDLVVAAYGCLDVPPRETILLNGKRPKPKQSSLGVIAAGTGLGEARLIWDGTRHLAVASEGGHCDFAPQTPLEIEFWHFLSSRFPEHVSYERVVSGAGLGALYDFFVSRAGREPRSVSHKLAAGDRNAAIAELGLARAFRPAARAVDLFATIYGAEAGNLVLRELAFGGVFVTGNIGRQILPHRREQFLDGFQRKGRFAETMRDVPVAMVTDALIGVRGALAIARSMQR
jgi:glucokinase